MEKLTQEELNLILENIKHNMAEYDKDIKRKMEHSDKVELDMYKVNPAFLNQENTDTVSNTHGRVKRIKHRSRF